MRFSLGTLLYGVLFISVLSVVWAHRHSWYAFGPPREISAGGSNYILSPDNTRIINIFNDQNFCAIYARENYPRTQIELHTIPEVVATHAFFVDDETILLGSGYLDKNSIHRPIYQEYRRRYPEWWWGHFLRPELYALAALLLVLLIRMVQFRRRHA